MNLNKALSETITKGAARANRKPITNLRRDVAMLKREVAGVKRQLKDLSKQAKTDPEPAPETQDASGLRPTSKAVLKLRLKLGLTQTEFAKLAGVSTLTVYKWEKAGGRTRMRGPALAGFARLRAMGKREVRQALADTESSGKS